MRQSTHPLVALATAALLLSLAYAVYMVASQLTAVSQQGQPLVIQLPETAVNQQPTLPTAVPAIEPKTAVNGLVLDMVPTPYPTLPAAHFEPIPTLTSEFTAACEAGQAVGRRVSPKCRDVESRVGR